MIVKEAEIVKSTFYFNIDVKEILNTTMIESVVEEANLIHSLLLILHQSSQGTCLMILNKCKNLPR